LSFASVIDFFEVTVLLENVGACKKELAIFAQPKKPMRGQPLVLYPKYVPIRARAKVAKMAELRISAEVMEELGKIVKRLQAGDVKGAVKDFERIREKIEVPPEITTKGTECGACVSCGACPVAYIKAGYLLTATMLT
jgi:hypothetical protein